MVRDRTEKAHHGSVFEGKSSEGTECCCSNIGHGDSWSGSCSGIWLLSFAAKLSAKYCCRWGCARCDIWCCYRSRKLWSGEENLRLCCMGTLHFLLLIHFCVLTFCVPSNFCNYLYICYTKFSLLEWICSPCFNYGC